MAIRDHPDRHRRCPMCERIGCGPIDCDVPSWLGSVNGRCRSGCPNRLRFRWHLRLAEEWRCSCSYLKSDLYSCCRWLRSGRRCRGAPPARGACGRWSWSCRSYWWGWCRSRAGSPRPSSCGALRGVRGRYCRSSMMLRPGSSWRVASSRPHPRTPRTRSPPQYWTPFQASSSQGWCACAAARIG